jgi:hypothetical protein
MAELVVVVSADVRVEFAAVVEVGSTTWFD